MRYFKSQPEGHRTTVYHSILVNYLAYARELGFTHAHIWVSPPKQGDDYIFYAHPVRSMQAILLCCFLDTVPRFLVAELPRILTVEPLSPLTTNHPFFVPQETMVTLAVSNLQG